MSGIARWAVLPVIAALSAASSACALFAPRFQSPHLTLVSVDFERGGLLEQQLKVRMRVENPNDRALPVRGLDYTLALQGEEVAHGMSLQSFTVPPNGEAEFDTEVATHLAGLLIGLLGHGTPSVVEYRLSGKVELSAGWLRSLPFERHGQVRLR